MTKFVKNPAGAVHSVPDDFALPTDLEGKNVPGWSEVAEADASPQLLGKEADPAVSAVELHNLAEASVPDTPSTDAVGNPADKADASPQEKEPTK